MSSSRWRVDSQIDGDSVRLTLYDVAQAHRAVGVVTLPLRSYHSAAKDLIIYLTTIAQGVITETLSKRLWADAQSQTMGMDADAAVQKMTAFGWNQEKVDRYAAEMAIALSQRLVEMLPGSSG